MCKHVVRVPFVDLHRALGDLSRGECGECWRSYTVPVGDRVSVLPGVLKAKVHYGGVKGVKENASLPLQAPGPLHKTFKSICSQY